jgi:Ca-activated chloride channel family protein
MFIIKIRAAMENKDKIYDQFKEAATSAENKNFDRMDAVWNRVEEKLDNKKERRAAIWWKYTGIAALLLLFTGIGMYLLNNETSVIAPQALPQQNVTVIDTQKIKDEVRPKLSQPETDAAVVTTVRPAPKKAVSNKIRPDSVNEPYLNKAVVNNSFVYQSARPEIIQAKARDTYSVTEAPQAEMDASPIAVATDANGNTIYSGTVNDLNKFPIPGVDVVIKGTNGKKAQTDLDGKFQLSANPGDVLVFSFIGMKPQEIRLAKNNTIDVAMADNNVSLDEVVVIGYGTRKTTSAERKAKREERRREKEEANKPKQEVASNEIHFNKDAKFTTAKKSPEYYFLARKIKLVPGKKIVNGVTNVTIAEMPNDNSVYNGYVQPDTDKNKASDYIDKSVVIKTNPNIAQSLQGQVAGVEITTESLFKNPVTIRGVTSVQTSYNNPLYIIDGVPADAEVMRSIDPNNIESINVLKDNAATSLYGSRAANGVIILKTKNLNRKQKRVLKIAIEQSQQAGYTDSTTGKFVPMEKIKIDTEEYESFEENKFENPATAPLSTFSIDVDNASYTNVRRFINNGQIVPKDAVRVEEMINFFKYSYPQPKGNAPFSVSSEYSDAPWNPKHKLLKIGLQGKELASNNLPASNFVFLIDVSGSMNDPNKLPLLKQSMKLLVNQMRPQDKLAIVVYAGAAGLVLPSTSGADKNKIISALENLSAGGSTAGGAGIELAYKTAQESFIKGGNNRVILATDGDFNVGASSNTDMQLLIEEKRKSGVFLTCLGYGMGNYKDSKLETLADKGNGNYAYIDNMQEADRFLDKEFKGSMYAIAKDVKIQIEFNAKHVQSYRLIGYENRKLRDEDFANDAVDAGELGSGHIVTALYEIIPVGVESDFFKTTSDLKYSEPQATTGNFNDELATIKLRYKKPDGDKSTETVSIIANILTPAQTASADFKFAAAVAWFGLKLRDSKLVPNKDAKAIYELAKQGLLYDPEGYRAEFLRLVQMVE